MRTKRIWQHTPCFDAAGRFSWLRLLTLALCVLPALWLAGEFTSGNWDFPSPYVPLIYHSGLWATYFLLFSLAVTPLRRITGWNRLAQLRRMLGVASCLHTLLHVWAWLGLRFWDWGELAGELGARPTLWIASAALVLLLALTATSFDAAIRMLGAPRWKLLHRAVYAAALLAVLHFLMSPGSLQGVPFLMAGFYVWLMGWRLLEARHLGTSPKALALLGLASALLAYLLEPVWLVTYQAEHAERTPLRALADAFDPAVWAYLGVPPVWILLASTLCAAAFALGRRQTIHYARKYHGRVAQG